MDEDIIRWGESPGRTAHVQSTYRNLDPIILNGAHPWDPVNNVAVTSNLCVIGLGTPHPLHFVRSLGNRGMSVPCPPNCPFCDPTQWDTLPENLVWEPCRGAVHFPVVYLSPSGRPLRRKEVWQLTEVYFEKFVDNHGSIKPGMCFEVFRDPHPEREKMLKRVPGLLIVNKSSRKVSDIPQAFDVKKVIRTASSRAMKLLGWMNADGSFKPDVLARLTHNGHTTNGHNGHTTNGHANGHDGHSATSPEGHS